MKKLIYTFMTIALVINFSFQTEDLYQEQNKNSEHLKLEVSKKMTNHLNGINVEVASYSYSTINYGGGTNPPLGDDPDSEIPSYIYECIISCLFK